MDLIYVIEELIKERNRLDALIRALEKGVKVSDSAPKPRKSKRGRKFMDAAERLEVAARMRRYWENRKKTAARGTGGGGASDSQAAGA
jgi:hypothetical protein